MECRLREFYFKEKLAEILFYYNGQIRQLVGVVGGGGGGGVNPSGFVGCTQLIIKHCLRILIYAFSDHINDFV